MTEKGDGTAPRKSKSRAPRKTKSIDKRLKAVGAAPLVLPTRGDEISAKVNEEQIALSAWASEDAAAAFSILSIIVALFALFVAGSGWVSGPTIFFVGGMTVALISLAYFSAYTRRTATAAAAIIAYRAQFQASPSARQRPVAENRGRHPLIEVRINRPGQ